MRRLGRVLTAVLAVVAGGVFTLDAADVSRRSNPAAASDVAAPAVASSTSVPTAPSHAPGVVTLAFAGDVHFEHGLADRLGTDPASIFGDVTPVLAAADVAVVNL